MKRQPDAPALVLNGTPLRYAELGRVAGRLARWLGDRGLGPGNRVGVLARHSLTAYTGILGVAWAGCSFVPLNPTHPAARLRALLQRARLDALVVDADGQGLLEAIDATPPLVAGPDLAALDTGRPAVPVSADANELAYLMFTSGTTGVPKGVMISQQAIHHFLGVMQRRYVLEPSDRVSQFFELTFDLSIFDLFMTWSTGACLHVLPDAARMAPADFIREQRLTVWFSVPSALVLMDRFRQLRPDSFPDLRIALFCGEPLPADPVRRWLRAAPRARTENLYGPTEATLACLLQACEEPLPVTGERGSVAIGIPLPGMRAGILGDGGRLRDDSRPGELVLSGPQLADGYWDDEALTRDRFPLIGGSRSYRTGDRAYRDDDGRFHHLGRLDNQIKIFGHRVELEDIDAHLRQVCGCDTALTVAWPVEHGTAQGTVAFVSGSPLSVAQIREAMKRRIPDYMVPRRVIFVDSLPLNANGKFDRNALLARLDATVS